MNIKELEKIFQDKYSENIVFLQNIINKLNIEKNATVLDIGTGGGRMAVLLALNGFNVITGEPEGHNWGEWRELAKEADVETLIEFRNFRAEKLPFETNSFDVIFIFGSLHHITERYKALKECKRVMNQNGFIVVIEFTQKGVKEIRKKHPTHPDAVDPREYTKNLSLSVKIFETEMINAYIFSLNN